MSEDPSLGRFEPRDGKVWAIDTRHLPLYWFPRDCPRAGAGIELRIAPGLLTLWDAVVASTLDLSGIRLRNATLAS